MSEVYWQATLHEPGLLTDRPFRDDLLAITKASGRDSACRHIADAIPDTKHYRRGYIGNACFSPKLSIVLRPKNPISARGGARAVRGTRRRQCRRRAVATLPARACACGHGPSRRVSRARLGRPESPRRRSLWRSIGAISLGVASAFRRKASPLLTDRLKLAPALLDSRHRLSLNRQLGRRRSALN